MNSTDKLYEVRMKDKNILGCYFVIYIGYDLEEARSRMEKDVLKIVENWEDKAFALTYQIKEDKASLLIKADDFSTSIKYTIEEM